MSKEFQISKGIYVHINNDEDKLLLEFAKLYAKHKRGTDTKYLWEEQVKKLDGRSGFVGSGRWTYEYKGVKFEIDGHANGRGFWGTTYLIYRVK